MENMEIIVIKFVIFIQLKYRSSEQVKSELLSNM